MAEQRASSAESRPEDIDMDLATGIGVVINIGHKCSHLTTSNSATGSNTRNFHLMCDGSNNHVGNDSHDASTAISGTIFGSNLTPHTRNTSEVRARSMPPPSTTEHITSDPTGLSEQPSSFLRTPYHIPPGRKYPESTLSSPGLRDPQTSKPRSSSLSALARGEARFVGFDSPKGGPTPYTATHLGHTVVSLAHPPYIDKPPHQDVAIQHIHCEPEASLQTDWIDSHLLGRIIELSAEDTHLHRRTMVVMAVSTGAKFLQCLHICRHPEMLKNSAEFYETHVAVVEKRQDETMLVPGDTAVIIDHPETYALRNHCYINYQHVWTVRRDVRFRNIGLVDDYQRLKQNFREAQKVLYQDE